MALIWGLPSVASAGAPEAEWTLCVRLAAQRLAEGREPAASVPDLAYAVCDPLMQKMLEGQRHPGEARLQAENQLRRQLIRETVLARHGIAPP